MSDYFFNDTQGNLWWSDLDAISILLRRWAQAKAYDETTSINESDGIQELYFDAARFRSARERYHQQEMISVSQNIYTNPNRVANQLGERYQEIPRLQQSKRQTVRRVLTHNQQALSRRVTRIRTTITALRLTRDISAAIFMCCIPGAGLGVEAAVLLRLAGSAFQGVGTYQDTGNVGAAIATGVLSFKSSLMVLPDTAGRTAQIIFTVVNTNNTAVANAAVRTLTVEPGSATTFTDILREEAISGGLGAATSPVLEAVNSRISGKLLPIFVEQAGSQATSTLAGRVSDALQPSTNGQNSGQASSNGRVRGHIAVARLQQEINRRQQQQNEAAWQSIPFYRYLATGDRNVLLNNSQQFVMGNLLRRGDN